MYRAWRAVARSQFLNFFLSRTDSQLPQYLPRPFFLVICLPVSVYL